MCVFYNLYLKNELDSYALALHYIFPLSLITKLRDDCVHCARSMEVRQVLYYYL